MKNDSTLAYLRRLNPVPEAASVDGAELFERITSLPRDERPAPRRSATRRRVALVAVGLAVMALLATTALAISGWFGDVVKPPVTRQEYKTPACSPCRRERRGPISTSIRTPSRRGEAGAPKR